METRATRLSALMAANGYLAIRLIDAVAHSSLSDRGEAANFLFFPLVGIGAAYAALMVDRVAGLLEWLSIICFLIMIAMVIISAHFPDSPAWDALGKN